MSELKIAAVSVNQTPLDWRGNLLRIQEGITQAKAAKAKLVCFPELCITGYGSEDLFLSDWYPQKALRQLQALLPHTHGITAVVGLPVKIQKQVYNTVAVMQDGSLLGFVAKQFMAIDGVHYEFRWFTPWKAYELIDFDFFGQKVPFGDQLFELEGITYGFEICEDAWRGDHRPGYRLAKRGVDLILNPSASHFAMGKTRDRIALLESSSATFNCYYCYVNLLGNEAGRMIFDGETMLAKSGKLLGRANLLSFQDVVMTTFELKNEVQLVHPVQSKEEEFAQASSLALLDYMRKSKSKGFVLSLSGGADSSTCAVLVAEMVKRASDELGFDAFKKKAGLDHLQATSPNELLSKVLFTAYQGTKNSSEDTFGSAKELAESLGATFYDWQIDDVVESYRSKIERAIGRPLTWEQDDITLQNIQARSRSPIIWMLSNLNNALLMATSNRSEGDVGYTTMDGDTSGSISPIAAVSKTFIIQWLRWAEQNLGYTGLQRVNSLQPTAELRPKEQTQTDEKDLMPYPILLEIEKLAIRDQKSPVVIYSELNTSLRLDRTILKGYIRKFFQLWSRNQWKRERLAPSFHLDEFNVDPKTWYRFPILSAGYAEELDELELID
ncbi:NAD(+) synthase [Algoriphagus namhaensis]